MKTKTKAKTKKIKKKPVKKSKAAKAKAKASIGKLKVSRNTVASNMWSDPMGVRRELAECLIQGDRESFLEVLSTYVNSVNKKQLSEKKALSRDSVYRVRKKENISVDLMFKVISAA